MCGRTHFLFLSSLILLIASASSLNDTCFEPPDVFRCTKVTIPIGANLNVTLFPFGDGTIGVGFASEENTTVSARKMKMGNVMQFLLIPAFAIAGIMPWIMPALTLAVAIIGLFNQIIFSASLFTLVRTYVFDLSPEEHVIYINSGYDKKTSGR